MTQQTYRFFEDAGHGWLEVPKSEVEASGIEVTPCSYYDPITDMVYLEEDVDMPNYFKATSKGIQHIGKTIHRSKPRHLPSYRCGETR